MTTAMTTRPVHPAPCCPINLPKLLLRLRCGRLAKVDVEGSNPFSRSKILTG